MRTPMTPGALFFLFILVLLVPGSARGSGPDHIKYEDKVADTPDLKQKQDELPGKGSQYCCPVSASNAFTYLSKHGFPALLPSGGQVQLAKLLGSPDYMNTSVKNGTGPDAMRGGVEKYVTGRGYRIRRLITTGWRVIDPRIKLEFLHPDGHPGPRVPCLHLTKQHPSGHSGPNLPCTHVEAKHPNGDPVMVPCLHPGSGGQPAHPGGHQATLPCHHYKQGGGVHHPNGHKQYSPCVHLEPKHPQGDPGPHLPCGHMVPKHVKGHAGPVMPCVHLANPNPHADLNLVMGGIEGHGAVWLNIGWYHEKEEGRLERFGGHWVTLVGYRRTPGERPILLIHDSSGRSPVGDTEVVTTSLEVGGTIVYGSAEIPAGGVHRLGGELKKKKRDDLDTVALLDCALILELAAPARGRRR